MTLEPARGEQIAAALGAALGRPVTLEGERAIGGGCINHAARLDTSAGPFFLKWNQRPIPDPFEREAEGLRALADARSGLAIPAPICWGPGFLVTELMEPGGRGPDFDARLGEGLARLHQATAPRFGFPHDNYCGAAPQPNGWMDAWLDFYRERRLAHQLELAARRHGVSARDRRAYERLLDRLPELLGIEPEPPALIHGDLWGGNLHTTPGGEPALIDPAAYYGHREAELGMMVLFGGFSRRVFEAYHAARPLQPGWERRIELYTLYHLMNHYTLFGGGYGAQAFDIVRRWVG